jgi:Tfp pilus assembly protein PilW
MLTRGPQAVSATREGEAGFTLIELLVAMIAGIAVLGALFTIVDVTFHQTTRTFSRVDATQAARTTLETIEGELHSACVVSGVTPIQAQSSAANLVFLTAYGNAASPTAVEHQITFSSATGTLIDSTYAATGGNSPNWTFSTTASTTRTLLSNVAQSASTPIFQYFDYEQPTNSSGVAYTDSGGNTYMMLLDGTSAVPGTSTIPTADPLSTPLSTGDAQTAAEVLITLVAKPSGGSNEQTNLTDAADTVTDSVVLRLTPAANHVASGATFGPCQ